MASGDTIFALSSGAVPAGLAVIRLSGPQSRAALVALGGCVSEPRDLRYCTFRAPDGAEIDRGLAVFFAGPKSFTGEDIVELHLHGSRATVARMLAVLAAMPGLRSADAGEFTLRAFRNGKLDLTEAEALADLISAETERQRQLALANASGHVRDQYDAWRGEILEALAMVEAVLDFADEEDAPEEVEAEIWARTNSVSAEIDSHLQQFHRSQIIRDGYRVAIVGAPNAGKSSLINLLAGRDVAIVTDEPGTTRDVIEVDLDLGGLLVKLADTAGIREAEAMAERLGIERSLQMADSAEMIVLLDDLTAPVEVDLPATAAKLVRVGNKQDLMSDSAQLAGYDHLISTRTGYGIDVLLQMIETSAAEQAGHSELLPFRERHVALLRECAEALRQAASLRSELELTAEELRRAGNSIGRITGRIDVEDLLDVIFSRFCIGK